ncbi:MAG: inverse autotransporter beta domain-containing protein [Legionellales bacterium]|nr:inverse autotransporter beta domain-containing protein [Legionellales bacterium]
MKNRLFTSLSVLLSLFCVSMSHSAEEVTGYETRIELTGKIGYSSKKTSKRNIGRLGFVVPMFQKLDSHLGYVTLIGMADSAKHVEGNFGVGYRSFINPAWILGEYVFYDLRSTENNNLLSQVTIGLEAFSKNLEFRINGYIPTKKKYELKNYNHYKASYNKHRNYTQYSVNNKKVIEQGVPGFDIEIGGSHRRLSRVELFAAYYYFNGKDLQSTIGGRLRSNIHLYHWLTTELEVNYDNNRGFVSYLGLRLGWTLGKNSAYKSWSQIKMTQLPVRDIDIISSSKQFDKKLASGKGKGLEALLVEGIKDEDTIEELGGAIIGKNLEELLEKKYKDKDKTELYEIKQVEVQGKGDSATIGDLKSRGIRELGDLIKKQKYKNMVKKDSSLKVKMDLSSNKRATEELLKEKRLREEAEERNKQIEEKIEEEKRLREEEKRLREEEKRRREEAESQIDTLKEAIDAPKSKLTENLIAAQALSEKYKRDSENLQRDLTDAKDKYRKLKENSQKQGNTGSVNSSKELKKAEKEIERLKDKLTITEDKLKEASKDIPEWKKKEMEKRARDKQKMLDYKKRQAKKAKQNTNNDGSPKVLTGKNLTKKQKQQAMMNMFKPKEVKKSYVPPPKKVKTAEQLKQERELKEKLAASVQAQNEAKKKGKTGGPDIKKMQREKRRKAMAAGQKVDSKFGFENFYNDRKKDGVLDTGTTDMLFKGQVKMYIQANGVEAASKYLTSEDRLINDPHMETMFKEAFTSYLGELAGNASINLGAKTTKKKKRRASLPPGRANLMAMLKNRTTK